MYQVNITKLSTTAEAHNMRTESMEGTTDALPTEGRCFRVVGDSLSVSGGYRLLLTSVVRRVSGSVPKLYIDTCNSRYLVEITSGPESDVSH